MEGGAHSAPFACLCFDDSKQVPVYYWVDRESFSVVGWPSRGLNSRPLDYGSRLRKNPKKKRI